MMLSKSESVFWLFCNPMDHSPPGSSVHGIFQARILEWDLPGGLSNPGVKLGSSALQMDSLPCELPWNPIILNSIMLIFSLIISLISLDPSGKQIQRRWLTKIEVFLRVQLGVEGPHGAGQLPRVCSHREGCRMKHLWNLEKGSSDESVVTSSEGHSEGPLQGPRLRNQSLSPSSPSFDLLLGSHWLNPTQTRAQGSTCCGLARSPPGRERWEVYLEGQIHMFLFKRFLSQHINFEILPLPTVSFPETILFELYRCISFALISRAVFESPNTALRELQFLNIELLNLSMILLLEFLPRSQIDFQLLLLFILIDKLYLNISTLLCNYLLFYF